MITENVRFELTSNKSLILSHLAVTGSAKILVGTHWVSVDKYDIYGAPILPNSLIKIFSMEKEFVEASGSSYTIQVHYTQLKNSFSPELLSNLDYVNFKLRSALGFIDYLCEVKKFKKEFPNYINFQEFVFYGKFWLNKFGIIMELAQLYDVPENVVKFEDFKKIYPNFALSPFPIDSVINSDLRCPYCLQDLTLNDILNDKVDWRGEDGPTHKSCQNTFYSLSNRSDIFSIMRYSDWDVSNYNEIPNEYGCNCQICKNRPWFIFHTSDGDIKIGWRKRVISIEFMKGFSEFPMSIFEDEDVTKWEKGIHAWGKEKAIEYLTKVHKYLH